MLYKKPQFDAHLEQGEILHGVHEHRVWYPASEPPGKGIKSEIRSISYRYTIVLNPACDLEQDFNHARFTEAYISEIQDYQDKEVPNWIPHIVLLPASDNQMEIKARIAQPELWNQVEKNEHKRYHRLEKSFVEDVGNEIATLYIDFKKPIALPTVSIYEGIRVGKILRVAVIPAPYIYDLIQRFNSFFSRIGLP